MAQAIANLDEVIGGYDVVFCDVWGVLHNGVAAYKEAGEALSGARARGAIVVLITNSPRPGPSVVTQLQGLGVPDAAYDGIVTSGDVTRHLIAAGPKKVFLLGPERDLPLFDGLDVELVSAEAAESVVCTGFFDEDSETPEDYTAMLGDFIARRVHFICANPDLVVERGNRIIPCAGAVAAYYETLGGRSHIAGKPYSPIYDAAFAAARALRGDFSPARVIAIGDGLPTDVRGGLDRGLDVVYIAAGIHTAEYSPHGEIDGALLDAWLKQQGVAPRYWMPRLA